MQTEIRVIDEESKVINWGKIDKMLDKFIPFCLKVALTVFAIGLVYWGLLWIGRM